MIAINISPFHRKRACILVISIAILFAVQAHAEIATDGTLGPALNLTGPGFRIGHELGVTAGANLFHSFDRFNVNSGESATFTGPDTLDNVISRVTGGNVSSIDGRLRSEIGTADFYFINPAGVVFGPNARVDVPGSFHVSTADDIRFTGGSIFSATNPAASSLTAEAPESFGYLGPRAASLVVKGSKLTFAPGSKVSLIGGDVTVQGEDTDAAKITVPDGELRIYAVGNNPDDVNLTGELNAGGGALQVIHALIETSGEAGGNLRIGAGKATITDATLAADNTGETTTAGLDNAGTVTIRVTGLLELLNGGVISSSTFGSGDAGGVEIEAGNLRINGQGSTLFTRITSDAGFFSLGNAGKVTIRVADRMEVLNGGQISSGTYASGDAGGVEIETGSLRIDGQGANYDTGITSDANLGSSGKAGSIAIRVADLLELLNEGRISSGTWGASDAGEIKIEADRLRIDGQGAIYHTGITSNAGYFSFGKSGTVTIRVADLLELLNGGQISSDINASGDAGGVDIEAGNLRIDGQGAMYYTGITSDANPGSSGKAGTVAIRVADLLELLNGGQISTNTFGAGGARGMEIEAGSFFIDGQGSSKFTGIRSQAQSGSSGKAGTVTIEAADRVELLNGGAISSSAFAAGDAGDVELEARNLHVDGQGSTLFTGIGSTAEPNSSGSAGTVAMTVTDLLEVLNGGAISSSTWSSGNAGSVGIHAGELLVDGQGSEMLTYIASASVESAQGFAGNLDIAVGKLTARNGGAISISTAQTVSEEKLLQAGKAHLFINSPLVILDQGALITAQSWGNVPAAAIGIEADEIRISGGSSITTSSTEADGGPITLQGEIIDLRDSLITSSVEGLTGDGGDITIKGADAARALILEGGFIQANAPAGARGGDIFIDVKAVIPEGGTLEVGGPERQRFEPGSGKNIIQAAAPGGEQGSIRITSPELDISGSLVNLDARLIETIRLAADPCRYAVSPAGSSLVFAGTGGVPAGPDQHAALFFDEDRLDKVWVPDEEWKKPAVQ